MLIDLYYATEGADWDSPWDISDQDYCHWYGIECDIDNNVTEM